MAENIKLDFIATPYIATRSYMCCTVYHVFSWSTQNNLHLKHAQLSHTQTFLIVDPSTESRYSLSN